MTTFVARFIQRFTVLVIGLVVMYVAAWQIYPLFHHRVPFAIALLVTYGVMAYLLLPAGARALHLLTKPSHLPLYSVTPDGFASDPINIGVIGSRDQIIEAMEQAGWYEAERYTPRTIAKEIVSVLLRKPYPNAPFSSLYLFGRRQDLGFEQGIPGRLTARHHVRFWACNLQGPEEFHRDVHFWRRFQIPQANKYSRQLWVGAASKDVGLAPIRYNAQLTHRVAPDTNAERELIVQGLKHTKQVKHVRTITVGRPIALRNRALRSFLHADGKLAICELKD